MLIFQHFLARMHVQLTARRTFTISNYRGARFQNKQIRDKFKNVMDKNIEAKQFYIQKDCIEFRPPKHLWRAVIFFIGTGLTTFTCAAIVQYYNARKRFQTLLEQTVAELKRIYLGNRQSPFEPDLDSIVRWIIGINIIVFLLWRVVKFQPFMTQYFASGFASKNLCLPMLLSVFSHSYILHLAANMYVMYSFSVPVTGFLGKEQFLAFYLTSGVFSSLISLTLKCLTQSTIPSVGASGAIAALIGYFCTMVPDARLSLIFLPSWHFSSQNALHGMLLFEFALLFLGIFTPFKIFDNGAHIGGLLFGMWYAQKGEEFYRRRFMPTVVKYWPMTGLGHNKETPIIIYDGKKHRQSKLENLHDEEFGLGKRNKKTEADAKREFQLERKKLWNEYQQEQTNKQRQRKMQILQQRRRQQIDSENEIAEEDTGNE